MSSVLVNGATGFGSHSDHSYPWCVHQNMTSGLLFSEKIADLVRKWLEKKELII